MSYNCYGNFALVRNIKIRCTFDKSTILDSIAIEKAKKIVKKSAAFKSIDLNSGHIYKKSIDARNKSEIFIIYTIAFSVNDELKSSLYNASRDLEFCSLDEPDFECKKSVSSPPVVVGFGPAGMFCALALAKAGLKPIVIERGADIDVRTQKVETYWREGTLDIQSNVQFGEGGAGTFSDGKLLTRISDKLCRYILNEFVKHGAPYEIMYQAKPHIGTDNLRMVVKNIRKEIIELGGKVIFNCKFVGFNCNSVGKVTSVLVDDNQKIECGSCFICIGHSARDTFKVLLNGGVNVCAKPFSVGVRIEHLQSKIDEALYGEYAGCESLGPASYTLSSKFGNRAVYSFCMCPGGTVVASASDNGQIVTNGMSYYARDGRNANSALAVSVDLADYGGTVDGAIEFQENIERAAFNVAGGNGSAPIQLLGDFLSDRITEEPSDIMPTYTGKTVIRNARNVFPSFITDNLAKGIGQFDKEISSFSFKNAVLTFPETRTSSPVRIPREKNYCAVGFENLFPCGEGAGYAGGITSAAVDGLRAALSYMKE